MSQAELRSPRNKWLLGCGIGCGAVVLIVVILAIAGVFFVRGLVQSFKESDETMKILVSKYGWVTDFRPNPDGSIPRDRLEIFLSARDAALPVRRKLEESLAALSRGRRAKGIEVKSPGNAFSLAKQAFGIVPRIAEYFNARNRALLDRGMGMGEYGYIYVTAYHGWLKKPVTDGPGFRIVGGDEEKGSARRGGDEGREYHEDMILRWIHSAYLPMLKNQSAGPAEAPEGAVTGSVPPGEKTRWRDALAAEIKALEADRFRIPWRDGMPDVLSSSLEPFRDRLEASYSPVTNPLETLVEKK